MSEFKIGADHAGLDWISVKLGNLTDPRSDPIEYASQILLPNGTTRNMGWKQQVWHWDFMTEAQCELLRAFIGSVNILTMKNDGTFAEYTAILTWPSREPEHRTNRVLDVSVMFLQMVPV